ncbi:MAG: nuclear transport factor 2 family protein [Chloroflexota bacterium]|nr:nuclear transport factor 2 family protein [Chloroflexota bacterium]
MAQVRVSLSERLVEGIAGRDEAAIAACFADDARFRALVPPGLRERTGASDIAALVTAWFRDSTEFDLVDMRADEVGDRVHISYRFAGVEEGDPYIIEQQLFCTVSNEKIERADLLCSGFLSRPR